MEQRKQEIGIRIALGANRSRVIGMVVRQALVLIGTGTSLGIGLSLWTNRLLRGFLFGVVTSDPRTMVLIPLILILCGLLATTLPALQAATVNPVETLEPVS